MNELSTEKTMTIKELANFLNVLEEDIKWHIRHLFPDIIKNDVETRLTENQIYQIKKKMIFTSQLVATEFKQDNFMTVKEIADVLGVTERTIQNHVSKLFPEIVVHGEKTLLNELQVTAIKNNLSKNYSLKSENVFAVETKEDKKAILRRAFEILQDENEELRTKIAIDAPKVESYEALQRSDKNMSITMAAKHFGLKPIVEVYPYLRSHGYLTTKDLPTQKAIDEKILSVKESLGNDGKHRPQAVVDTSSLEIWRTKLVNKIKGV